MVKLLLKLAEECTAEATYLLHDYELEDERRWVFEEKKTDVEVALLSYRWAVEGEEEKGLEEKSESLWPDSILENFHCRVKLNNGMEYACEPNFECNCADTFKKLKSGEQNYSVVLHTQIDQATCDITFDMTNDSNEAE